MGTWHNVEPDYLALDALPCVLLGHGRETRQGRVGRKWSLKQ